MRIFCFLLGVFFSTIKNIPELNLKFSNGLSVKILRRLLKNEE